MKVFISSTYLDLIEHRKAVVQALRTMGEEVGHMEVFGARDDGGVLVLAVVPDAVDLDLLHVRGIDVESDGLEVNEGLLLLRHVDRQLSGERRGLLRIEQLQVL